MAINKVSIKNFTVFNDIEVSFNDGINVIIGDNGTGKTHLLKLLYVGLLMRDDSLVSIDSFFAKDTKDNTSIRFICDSCGANVSTTSLPNLSKKEQCTDNCGMAIIESTELYKPLFIPAKEMLSMSNITRIDDKFSKELSIDKTLTDIIRKAQNIKPDVASPLAKKIAAKLEKIIDGEVFVKEDNSFWVRKSNQSDIPFSMEAEGFRKLGLLWQLIMNESIVSGTVLLWDEPEANINPRLIPELVEIILELSRNNVQVFITTHDYFLAKYVEVLSNSDDSVAFHSLYKTDDGVKCESSDKFSTLTNNEIITEKIRLYEAEIEKVTE